MSRCRLHFSTLANSMIYWERNGSFTVLASILPPALQSSQTSAPLRKLPWCSSDEKLLAILLPYNHSPLCLQNKVNSWISWDSVSQILGQWHTTTEIILGNRENPQTREHLLSSGRFVSQPQQNRQIDETRNSLCHQDAFAQSWGRSKVGWLA